MTHLQQIEQILFDMWMYDMNTLSNPWMYIPLCVPAFLYAVFMSVKWSVITTPLWMPFACVFQTGLSKFVKTIQECIDKNKGK